jgi:hypothetical protein
VVVKQTVSKQYRAGRRVGNFFSMWLSNNDFRFAGQLAPRLLNRGAKCTERPDARRRPVLVACSGPTHLRATDCRQQASPLPYMKARKDELHQAEPVGIVISRGARTAPEPIIHAFVWGPAPELTPVPKDTRAA